MNSWKKISLTIVLSGTMIISTMAQSVFAGNYLYEDRQRTTIGSGVTHERVLRFGQSGWLHMNVVVVDLEDERTEIDLLQSSQGVSHKETLGQMLTQKNNPIAAINTDFFYVTNPDSPLGVMVRDGKMVSSPVTVKPFSALAITKDQQAIIDAWQNHMYVSSQNGEIFSIKSFNKITWNYHQTTILDHNWGEKTPGATNEYPDLVEVVVVDDEVREVRRGLPPVNIPENGYVLLASGQDGRRLHEVIRQGEKLIFHPHTVPSMDNIKLAVGGGTPLVRNGQIASFTEPVTGNHPRTAVGIDSSGKKLILVTVDGRHASYKGVNGEVLARLMIEAGSHHALLMDGGGSTTMMTRNPGDQAAELANVPSDGGQRRIINALAVSSSRNGYEEIGGIVLEADREMAFKNHGVNLKVKGYDEAYRALEVNLSQVGFNVVEGSGRVENGRLIPEASGRIKLEASYQGKSDTMEFEILEEVAAIQVEAPTYHIGINDEIRLTVEGIDPEGYRAPLTFNQVNWQDSNNLGSLSDGVYRSGPQEGVTVLRASYNGHSAAIPMAVGSQRTALPAFRHFIPKFLGYPEVVTGNVRVSDEGKVNNHSVRLDFDLTGSIETTAAYVTFENDYSLPAGTSEIGVWVHAYETAPHWIRAQVKDGNGNNHIVDLKQGIDWTGWKFLSGNLSRNLKAPLTLQRLYVVEPEPFFKTSGTLLFDGMEAIAPLQLPNLTAEEAGGQLQDRRNRTPEPIESAFSIHSDMSLSKSGNTLMEKNQSHTALREGDTLFLRLNSQNNGIRQTNYQQWPWLKNQLSSNTANNVVLLINHPVWGPQGFTDELEAELFNSELSKLVAAGKNAFVFYGNGTTGTEMRDGVRYIGMGRNADRKMNLYQSAGAIYYKATDDPYRDTPPTQVEEEESPQAREGSVVFRVGQNYYVAGEEKVELDAAPYLKDDRLMVPVSHVSRALGVPRENVRWDGERSMAVIETPEGITMRMEIGSSKLLVNEDSLEMGTEAEIRNDRTFIPISRFARAMNVEYVWDPERQTVTF